MAFSHTTSRGGQPAGSRQGSPATKARIAASGTGSTRGALRPPRGGATAPRRRDGDADGDATGKLLRRGLQAVLIGVQEDVRHVLVGDPVHDLATPALALDEPGVPQPTQMLRDQRL